MANPRDEAKRALEVPFGASMLMVRTTTPDRAKRVYTS